MFPMEFDHRTLDTLPLPSGEGVQRVLHILKAIVQRRVLPYFKHKRGTDRILLARLSDRLDIERLEDVENLVRIISLFVQTGERRRLLIHERVFDYLAFVIPSDPEARLGDGTSEERKMLAFTELLLRHEIGRMLYPARTTREALQADVAFAMDRRASDPTYYKMLRQALADEMNGLRGTRYLRLLDHAEREQALDAPIAQILNLIVPALADLPMALLQEVFPHLDPELQTRTLGDGYRRSTQTSYSLSQRAAYLQKVLGLFAHLMQGDEDRARVVFNVFKDRWGLVGLFRELHLPEASVEDKVPDELFALFKTHLAGRAATGEPIVPPDRPGLTPETQEPEPRAPAEKSLKDRIEEAHGDPAFPQQVLEVIDKNKINAVGHSGAKYSELIETLLAVPWGKIHRIEVTPDEFEAGLDRTHYGLTHPKALVCDFFTNLIHRYREYREETAAAWHRMGSAFLLVGPPGVGKTSFAISIARNLGIPYHKFSLGGMRDEADIRGHGFTYEGSKPGAIVQGLIKMGVMNGMFILDEADKTEKFALATLLEILDPEQNHLFHDKYTQTTVDVDLSNCHFVLTANTLETVPPPVVNRCEVVLLDRYSVEEKVAIARKHLIRRIRDKYQIREEEIEFDAERETDLLRYLVKHYTYEAGVRQLERIIRTLFLRIQRKEILTGAAMSVRITRETVKTYLEEPRRPLRINEDDRVGEMLALGVDAERGVGSIIPIQATRIRLGPRAERGGVGPLSMVHATGNIAKVMDESRKVATTGILFCAEALGIRPELLDDPIHLHFMGASTPKDGPSAGAAIALALASLLADRPVRRDVAITGEIDTQGRLKPVGALDIKLETACDAGCRTLIIPTENLRGEGGLERLPEALKDELHILTYADWRRPHAPFDYTRHVLQVVAVDHVVQASEIALIDETEIEAMETRAISWAREAIEGLVPGPEGPGRFILVIQSKARGESGADYLQPSFWEGLDGATALVSPAIREAIREALPDLERRVALRDFDIKREKLTPVVQEILEAPVAQQAAGPRPSLVAPYFLMKLDGILAVHPRPDGSLAGLRIFANNYTVQGVKIKGCKSVLNRCYRHLSAMGEETLIACPFLGARDGIIAVDLSCIPEKYRLDLQRVEAMLNRCLARWLERLPSGHREPATGGRGLDGSPS